MDLREFASGERRRPTIRGDPRSPLELQYLRLARPKDSHGIWHQNMATRSTTAPANARGAEPCFGEVFRAAALGGCQREVAGAGEDGAVVIRGGHDGGTPHDRAWSLGIRDTRRLPQRSIAHFSGTESWAGGAGCPFRPYFLPVKSRSYRCLWRSITSTRGSGTDNPTVAQVARVESVP